MNEDLLKTNESLSNRVHSLQKVVEYQGRIIKLCLSLIDAFSHLFPDTVKAFKEEFEKIGQEY